MAEMIERSTRLTAKPTRSQDFHDSVKRKFAEERDLALKYRPNGLSQNTYELTGGLATSPPDALTWALPAP